MLDYDVTTVAHHLEYQHIFYWSKFACVLVLSQGIFLHWRTSSGAFLWLGILLNTDVVLSLLYLHPKERV